MFHALVRTMSLLILYAHIITWNRQLALIAYKIWFLRRVLAQAATASAYEPKGRTNFALIVILESAAAYFAIMTLHLVYTQTASVNVIIVGGLVRILSSWDGLCLIFYLASIIHWNCIHYYHHSHLARPQSYWRNPTSNSRAGPCHNWREHTPGRRCWDGCICGFINYSQRSEVEKDGQSTRRQDYIRVGRWLEWHQMAKI
jgi:hypothetical protein